MKIGISFIIFCAAVVVLFVVLRSKKTQGADSFELLRERYPMLKSISSEASFSLPCLSETQVGDEICSAMIPQGVCTADQYILITAYCGADKYRDSLRHVGAHSTNKKILAQEKDHVTHNSVIYVLAKSSGRYLTTIVLPDQNHVGGIAFDGENIWIAKSTDNELSVLPKSVIDAAVLSGEKSYTVGCYAKNISVSSKASFVYTYDGQIWIGVCTSKDVGLGMVRGYDIEGSLEAGDLSLRQVHQLSVPAYANGAAMAEMDGKLYLAVNVNKGRLKNGSVELFCVTLSEDEMKGETSFVSSRQLPPLPEDICVDGDKVYTIFEAGAAAYSNVVGFRCHAVVDRCCVGSLQDWFFDGRQLTF